MLFKTYQKLLGASCLALYLIGCGSGGGGESPVEIEKNDFNSTLKIISKADNVEIQDLKLNRGNCWHNRSLLKELMQRTANARRSVAEQEKAIKNHQAVIARLPKDLGELTQWVQSFNTLDKLWVNIVKILYGGHFGSQDKQDKLLFRALDSTVAAWNSGVLLDNSHDPISRAHDPISRTKDLLSSEYKPYDQDLMKELIHNISFAIEDTKNPKDYPYINLKELKKLIDSLFPDGYLSADFFDEDNNVSEKGLQRLAKLKSMLPGIGKFYFAYLKEAIPRHAREVADNLIESEEKSIQAIQAKLAETNKVTNKMEKTIKALESKKSTMAVDLKFGESFTAQYRCQNLIEVEVKTDKGSWTFNFNE
ncbi:hypothetical protein [Helicobacter pylori]|uniref:hypothetical protein n=1 Tax=Helicobacter pylori TaxID=210 RepID=UPI0019209A54|nr:hypothetical protein [Helicobacter pylori]